MVRGHVFLVRAERGYLDTLKLSLKAASSPLGSAYFFSPSLVVRIGYLSSLPWRISGPSLSFPRKALS